jgi:DNA polymerase-3 subunit gamma/tau
MLSEIMKAETDVRNSSAPRLALEMALIRASFLSTMKPLKEVIKNIDRYSTQVTGTVEAVQTLGPAHTIRPVETKAADIAPEETGPAIVQSAGEIGPTAEEEIPEDAAADISGDIADSEDTEEPVEEISSVIPPVANVNLSSAWAKTLEKIDPPLASKISQSSVEFREDGLLLTLDGGHAVFEDAIKKNLKSLEKIMSGEYGENVRIKLAISQKKAPRRKDLREKAMNEPVVREALELFDGRIVDVTPIENKQNGGDHV